jgi:hypothetical protein
MSSTALIYGGAGALGASAVQYFKEQDWVINYLRVVVIYF